MLRVLESEAFAGLFVKLLRKRLKRKNKKNSTGEFSRDERSHFSWALKDVVVESVRERGDEGE